MGFCHSESFFLFHPGAVNVNVFFFTAMYAGTCRSERRRGSSWCLRNNCKLQSFVNKLSSGLFLYIIKQFGRERAVSMDLTLNLQDLCRTYWPPNLAFSSFPGCNWRKRPRWASRCDWTAWTTGRCWSCWASGRKRRACKNIANFTSCTKVSANAHSTISSYNLVINNMCSPIRILHYKNRKVPRI